MGADRMAYKQSKLAKMAVWLRSFCRRVHYVPLQLLLPLLIVVGFVTYRSLSVVEEVKVEWSDQREEALRKYNAKEVDLNFIRAAGFVDHKIEDLTDEDINSMNETQLMVTLHSYLDNADIVCSRRIRMGSLNDDGWEVCDDEVYSFSNQDSSAFEYDMARVYKCGVHSFQPYYTGKDYNRTDKIFIHPFGIGRYSEITPEGNELYTIGDIRTILGHAKRNVDLIKMDIEGAEWSVLYGMLSNDELDNVKQLLVECHVGYPSNEDRMRRSIRVLRSLSEIGFRKFYVYKNPRGSFHHPNFPVMRAKNYEIHFLNSRFLKKATSNKNSEDK
ncbi:unnamed protein product [Candidula unifasciata]|uniref:Methyltransferase domain-containing protein n=1 Tax=Candidula unifasciata TaxID=100452 RepID=A0A8S3ZJ26_9EUPU|nr:unnamed protein product [Candidula unifasciata]